MWPTAEVDPLFILSVVGVVRYRTRTILSAGAADRYLRHTLFSVILSLPLAFSRFPNKMKGTQQTKTGEKKNVMRAMLGLGVEGRRAHIRV